jgi:IstB-like ATP binding protein
LIASCSKSSPRATESTLTTISRSSAQPASAKAGWPAPSATKPAATIAPFSIIAGRSSARTWARPRRWAPSRLIKSLGRADLLILDDFGLEPLDAGARHDLLEIIEERYGRRSTIVTSQLPLSAWHEVIGDPTYADAILDRLVHNAYRIELTGESLRRARGKPPKTA